MPEGGETEEIMKRNKAKSLLKVMTDINFRKSKQEKTNMRKYTFTGITYHT